MFQQLINDVTHLFTHFSTISLVFLVMDKHTSFYASNARGMKEPFQYNTHLYDLKRTHTHTHSAAGWNVISHQGKVTRNVVCGLTCWVNNTRGIRWWCLLFGAFSSFKLCALCLCVCFRSTDGEYLTFTRYEPIGVCGQIIPVSIPLPTLDKSEVYKWTCNIATKQITVNWLALKWTFLAVSLIVCCHYTLVFQ